MLDSSQALDQPTLFEQTITRPTPAPKAPRNRLSAGDRPWALVALGICALALLLTLPLSRTFKPAVPGDGLEIHPMGAAEQSGRQRISVFPLEDARAAQGPLTMILSLPLGADLKQIEFVTAKPAQAKATAALVHEASRLSRKGAFIALDLPEGTRQIRVTLGSDLWTPLALHLSPRAAFTKAQDDQRMMATALFSSLLLLSMFSFGVALFARLRMIEWFGYWLMALGGVCITASGSLGMLAPNLGLLDLDGALLGALSALFGFVSIRLRMEVEGRIGGPAEIQARRWLSIWLGLLGAASLIHPHAFLLGMILLTGTGYCILGSLRSLLALRDTRTPQRHAMNAIAWLLAGLSIAGAYLPWLGMPVGRPGLSLLFPTLYGAIFTAFMLSRAIRLERAIRRDAQKKAESSLKRVAEVLENTPIAMLSANYRGRLVSANLQARELWPRMDWRHPERLRLDDLVGDQYAGILAEAFRTKGSIEAIVNLPKGEHRPNDLICQLKLFRTANSLELTLIDITAQERMTRVLEDQVSTDPLTRLLNRRGLDQHLRALQALVNRNEAQASLLFIDLDRFKIVNDLYGHDYGDELLVQIALRTKAMGQNNLTVARIGGDEFVVLVPNASLQAACDLAEELRGIISNRPYPVRDKLLTVGASIGVVRLIKGMEPKDALTYADRACGQAKKSGRGRVEHIEASDKLLIELKTESHLQELMTSHLPTERLRIYAQPLVPLNGRPGLAYEILVRYVDEDNHVLPPGQLIAIAERQGMMSQLDKWVLESTLKMLDAHPQFCRDSLFFTVNLSGSSINDRRFLSEIGALFDRNAHLADRVILEITETVALLDTKYTRSFMDSMIAKGVRFALDDFGAGYTSFGYLKDLPANMLKIDGNFIASLSKDTSCQRIVRTMSTLSQQLGMQSVAEWVEDTRTLELLISLRIDYAQGYYFSPAKPMDFWVNGREVVESIQAKAQQFTRAVVPAAPRGAGQPHFATLV